MSVSILYYKVTPEKINSAKLSELISIWNEELPVHKQQKISKLRQQKDQVLSLAGLQLLKKGITEFTDESFSLKQLQFPAKSKPYFNDIIDFNISHSGDIVICILSNNMKVGIDIELQRKVTTATMNKYLSESSMTQNISAEEKKQPFFNLWTKKEAIIKAANYGSIYTMNEISLEKQGGFYQDHFWYTYPINITSAELDSNKTHSKTIRKEYTCHIATSDKITDCGLDQIKPIQIHNL